ncbi:hypothetical protein [Clostridium perfringens]|uniref:hypothetical protein n=1 Tax=Clostridium perfringens TaxID=1502 RepID=UPI000F52B89C|nr:hypothetical protein [Clostridium perfringens]
MSRSGIIIKDIETPSTGFESFEFFLKEFGLPHENVIAELDERKIVMDNLPNFLNSLSPEVKKDAYYLSKFVAGTAIGLFDASLNYVWNEVILSLREKIEVYGVEIFFDSAVGEKVRDNYKSKEDLAGLKDKVLLDTCRKLEIISDLVYKKLSHILMMRNDIGASHPNTYSINSFELLGWLKTCINDVLLDKPSCASIEVKSIVDNLRTNKEAIDESTLELFKRKITDLSSIMSGNLLVSIFGLFVSNSTEKIIKENILKLAPSVWNNCTDDIKYKLGEKLDGYRLKLDQERLKAGELFFSECKGKRYYTTDSRAIKLSCLSETLEETHLAWDNFYYEPAIAQEIMSYIENDSDIPIEREDSLIKIFLKCRIGNGTWYNDGVSPSAKPYYNKFFKLLNKNQVRKLLRILESADIRSLVINDVAVDQCIELLKLLKTPLIGDRLNEIIDYLINNKKNLYNAFNTVDYKDLIKAL